VVNGDFLIVRSGLPSFTTGDGNDEETSWTFDFIEDPNYRHFESRSGPLTSALLTLTLKHRPFSCAFSQRDRASLTVQNNHRDEVALIEERTALINQLQSALHEYYPAALEAFEDSLHCQFR
jgi:hypothetical protein